MILSRHPLARRLSELWFDEHHSLPEWVLLQALAPASWVYAAAMRARALAYRNGLLEVRRAPIPVISVGNLIVGGAGKTPVVIELARRLEARGHRPAILSRGYGASRSDARLVADAQGIHLPCAEAGDEPVLVARRCAGQLVLAGPDRALLAERAARQHGATVAILDDGMQHCRLHRDLEIVVIDGSAPLGNRRALPGGPLREPLSALQRADLLWISRADEVSGRPLTRAAELETLLARVDLPVVRAAYRIDHLERADGASRFGADHLAGRPVHVLCGVARPRSFFRTLTGAGARLCGQSLFGDHHPFSVSEVRQVLEEADRHDALVVTTEKDAQRLAPVIAQLPAAAAIVVVVVSSEILEGEAQIDLALARLP